MCSSWMVKCFSAQRLSPSGSHHGHHPGRNEMEFQALLPGISFSSIPKSSLQSAPCSWRLVQAGRAWSVSLGGRSCNSQTLRRRAGLPAGARSIWECLPAPLGTGSVSAARSAEEPPTSHGQIPDPTAALAQPLPCSLSSVSACLLGIGDPRRLIFRE